jgi:transcriptional regulator with XRE-family HTH domain
MSSMFNLPGADAGHRERMARFFGAMIRGIREEHGATIDEAAHRSGMSAAEWTAVEEGVIPLDDDRLRVMAEVLAIGWPGMELCMTFCWEAWRK